MAQRLDVLHKPEVLPSSEVKVAMLTDLTRD
jgi:hypothetical protein